VDLPEPSMPSTTINLPLVVFSFNTRASLIDSASTYAIDEYNQELSLLKIHVKAIIKESLPNCDSYL
ncbi:MAG TPA: hypothetical protein PLF95_09575, partial [Bacteroidales bacterium]|nr:hypothetical protein [Bacteroidales bacterium]